MTHTTMCGARRRPIDWGVPDWKTAVGYPPKGSSLITWAWEFLRRNHDYRKSTEEAEKGKEGESTAEKAAAKAEDVMAKFGLASLQPAWSSKPPLFQFGKGICGGTVETTVEIRLAPNELCLFFDLTLPLELQFNAALERAKIIQEGRKRTGHLIYKNSRARPDQYIKYLRLLDAIDFRSQQQLELKDKDIASIIYPKLSNDYDDGSKASTKLKDDKELQPP